MKKKKQYIPPEIEIIKVPDCKIMAGSQTHWVDAKQNNDSFGYNWENVNQSGEVGWPQVGNNYSLPKTNNIWEENE